MYQLLRLFLLVPLFLANTFAEKTEPVDLRLAIDDCKTYVGIASVRLTVSDLEAIEGKLIGTFKIEVPLKPSKNDEGRIDLPFAGPAEDLIKGATLVGEAYSNQPNVPPRKIVCEIIPGKKQQILLAITTDQRTLNFKSHYIVLESD